MYKIITFVPIADAEKLRKVIGDVGACALVKYHHASCSPKGVGRFIPGKGAHPTIGEVGKMSEVEEERIEVICEKDKVKEVVEAIRKNHPYEEVPLEIYRLIDEKEFA